MRAASVLSTHPVVATALGEAVGQVLEALGGARPALVLAALTPPHLGTLEDVGAALRTLLAPDVVLGTVAPAVIGGGRQVHGEPALALFAVAGVAAAALSLAPDAGRLECTGRLDGASAALVLADPASCSSAALADALPALPTGGGVVGAARSHAERGAPGPGTTRLLLDGEVRTSGAVGALLGGPTRARASQGGTPAGEPWVVTRSDADVVLELGGRPAAERRDQALGDGPTVAALGLLVDDHVEEPGRADLLAVAVLGGAPGGGLRVARPLPVGRVVRFLRTGPVDVEADLAAALSPGARSSGVGPSGPAGVLLFPGGGRDGDPGLAAELVGCPVAGIGVGAPLAAVGGVLGLHGPGATSVLVFP